MKKIFLVLFIFLTVCLPNGNAIGDDAPYVPNPEWVIKGDSMAWGLANKWVGAENDGQPGYAVQTLRIDDRYLDKAVLMAGANNFLCWHEAVEKTIEEYAAYYNTIKAGRIYCVGIPKIDTSWGGNILPEIKKLNTAIKHICGPHHYIDTWKTPFTSNDGLHPDDTMNDWIIQEILDKDSKIQK